MRTGKRRLTVPAAALAACAVVLVGSAWAEDAAPQRHAAKPRARPAPILRGPYAVETVYFGDRPGAAVRVVRGFARPLPPRLAPAVAGNAPEPRGQHVEIVSFGTGFASQVTVVRGVTAGEGDPARHIERVNFADPRLPAVTVVRDRAVALDQFSGGLFGPASGGELDRIAFAVDGVESRHGADLRMWRPEPSGPQGPMQISAAAAFDVGGGDRFDLQQNRLLGRAYLAQMFQRYGNWPDAVGAYNWGPGNFDLWIAAGRPADLLPPSVAWYIARVLRDALVTTAAR
jgi:hypothetical protein